jgi:hypothetical protein
MRAFVLWMVWTLILTPLTAWGAGLTQHQFMAEIGGDLAATPELVECLEAYPGELLFGGSFPDAGYAVDNGDLSEDMHVPAFIDAFVQYLQETFPYPYERQRRLIAFMLGTGSHVVDDPPYHAHFIARVAEEDFAGDYGTAHTWCDTGLEFVTLVEHCRGPALPRTWVPVADIVETLRLMGREYDPEDLVQGGRIIALTGYLERLVAGIVYFPVILRMPWAADNYYEYSEGGLLDGGERAAAYYEQTWAELMARYPVLRDRFLGRLSQAQRGRSHHIGPGGKAIPNPLLGHARRCLAEDLVEIEITRLPDGSVLYGTPVVRDPQGLERLLEELIAQFVSDGEAY